MGAQAPVGIDFVVVAKNNLRITCDAQGLGQQEADAETIFRQERRGTERRDKKGWVSEEVFVLLGVVPRWCFRTDPVQARCRYALFSVA